MYLAPKDPVTLLRLPNTLAGDAALTIIIQTLVTWLIEWAAVTSDLRAGKVAPLAYSPASPRVRRLLGVPEVARDGAGSRETGQDTPGSYKNRRAQGMLSLPGHAVRIIALLVPAFILFWPPSLAILTTVGTRSGSDYVFPSRWAPQVFKLVLGGVLGLLVTPLMALFWVMREGLA